MILNEMEVAALWESPEALQVLIDWHEEQVAMGDSQGYPMSFNKNRSRELKERRLKLMHPDAAPEDDEPQIARASYE